MCQLMNWNSSRSQVTPSVESSKLILQIMFLANMIILEHYVTLEESMCLLPDFETPLRGGSLPINGPQQRSLMIGLQL